MPGGTEPLRNEVRIAAPPEVVFPYFTDPARMVNWMGVAALLDPRPGGTFRVDANGRDVVVGEYVEVALERDGEGTLLTLLHHGLADGVRDAHAEGWTHYLARLAPVAAGRPAQP